MSILTDLRTALQEVVTPDLRAVKAKTEAIEVHLDSLRREMNLRFDAMNQRFDSLIEKLDLDRRLQAVEQELDEKRQAN